MAKRKKLDRRVLAEGEATGHAHRVTVDVYEEDDGLRSFAGPTTVTHEEHTPIDVPALPKDEDYLSGRAVEYDHFAEEARRVTD